MFDILEADIVVLQETKIQRRDLSDDMVLVPGWDCYFSLPRYKKGYSGVVIYTRQSVCAPIRAEEGITGLLCLPNTSTAFMDLPDEQQVGGYPNPAQLAESPVDAVTLDSEGRCVILEFPAFVLLGVYCPANRDETRNDFRLGFLDVLDARIRNLISMGKRVFLTGDLNISREELDAANAEVSMRKQGLDGLDFLSTPARRLLNQLLEGGRFIGDRDNGREYPVMWDICRAFHPDRRGMFTCWEQKVNARPGNCGARIDYVLCSLTMKGWFRESNIQEGLMGSDHCPVYALMKEKVIIDGKEYDFRDVMNPPGMFLHGKRQRQYSAATDPRQLSGRLIPEFSGRRNIRDMFSRNSSAPKAQCSKIAKVGEESEGRPDSEISVLDPQSPTTSGPSQTLISNKSLESVPSPPAPARKRNAPQDTVGKSVKRAKSTPASSTPLANARGQRSLRGFFKPKSPLVANTDAKSEDPDFSPSAREATLAPSPGVESLPKRCAPDEDHPRSRPFSSSDKPYHQPSAQARSKSPFLAQVPPPFLPSWKPEETDNVHDPIVSKESWSRLFTKPAPPRCESHDEPCISMLTKKQGINLGRSFWMCPRPLGPSGAKEKNTQWRCGTFIWCSDWNPNTASGD